ncbi:translocation and assembly module lipoprotein TamL [Aquimarina agarilytica]|uniref:translocation and assembly module lipoprotein TamL n=1 Tax=Aquimarina agarilytica TaxID=1087449 RepID=UPI0002895E0E|nr:BamA/TamA family outer membrane protein [Aquimarina agarilytica]
MNRFFTKISLILVLQLIILSCNTVKKVPENNHLLTQNTILVNGEKTKNKKLYNYLVQQPNKRLLGIPIKLGIYNLSKENADSIYIEKLKNNPKKRTRLTKLLSKKQVNRLVNRKINFNDWLKKTGEAPVIVDKQKIEKSQKKLEAYFWNKGWFNVSSTHKISPNDSLKASVTYNITTRIPYEVDSIGVRINSAIADSIYKKHQNKSLLKTGKQYNTIELENERNRITKRLRNEGLFHFERDFIKFEADTINTNKKVNLTLDIKNRPVTFNDSISQIPFKVHSISKVNIFTDSAIKNKSKKPQDSTSYKGFELFSYDKLKFKPKAITNAVFLTPNTIYRDSLRTLTYNSLNSLGVFKYPTITFLEDRRDPKGEDLIANIFLTPRKKYAIGFNFDVSTSIIQDIGLGFGGSLLIRNVFRRAESFEISARSNIGSSKDVADSDEKFFNISELGLDAKLSFPRILFPFGTDKIIKKSSAPQTSINIGITTQQNIGLDKESVSGIFRYKWKPNRRLSNQFDLFGLQYVRNLNAENYFNVYQNSYNRLNDIAKNILPTDSSFFNEDSNLEIPTGADQFINSVISGNTTINNSQFREVSSISERKNRLTEDNLILTTSYSLINDTRKNLYDENFSRFRLKIESAGSFLSTIASITNRKKNEDGNFDLFGVEFSQFIKFESEYIKHWDFGDKNILAIRGFGGVAFPYGNSNSIPFSQSYFGGGSNDNRAWTPYDLGPGKSGGRNEFNEANFKLAFNAEYRFNIAGALNGALFTDAGNIWNVLDRFEDEEDVTFSSIKDLSEIALGAGLGMRYDFSFFVLRLDAAWKIYNPARIDTKPWFSEINFSKTVFNVGINYPF